MTMQQDEAAIGFEVSAALTANLGRVADEMTAQRKYRSQLAQAVHPFVVSNLNIPIVSSAGSVFFPNVTGPQLGQYWDVKRIAVTGYTAGTVAVYLNAVGAELVANFVTPPSSGPIAGVQFFGKGHILLGGNDNLYFNATGITLAANTNLVVSIAGVEIAAPFIGDYLA